MMGVWMVLGKVICLVGITWLPKDVVLAMTDPVADPVKHMLMDLDHFCLMLSLAMPVAVVLSV